MSELTARLDSCRRSFAAQMQVVLGEPPASAVETGLQMSWRAAMKPIARHRFFAPKPHVSQLKAGEYRVEKIIGVKHKVR